MSHSVKDVGVALCGTPQCHCVGVGLFFLLLFRLGFTETSKDVSCPAFSVLCPTMDAETKRVANSTLQLDLCR